MIYDMLLNELCLAQQSVQGLRLASVGAKRTSSGCPAPLM